MRRLLGLILLVGCMTPAFAQSGCSQGPNGCGQLNTSAFTQATVASASTVPLNTLTVITGTAAISTFTPPPGFSPTVGGCYDILATGTWTTTTGGNIFNTAFTATANTQYRACYFTVA